jgi:hypothetical protein
MRDHPALRLTRPYRGYRNPVKTTNRQARLPPKKEHTETLDYFCKPA